MTYGAFEVSRTMAMNLRVTNMDGHSINLIHYRDAHEFVDLLIN